MCNYKKKAFFFFLENNVYNHAVVVYLVTTMHVGGQFKQLKIGILSQCFGFKINYIFGL